MKHAKHNENKGAGLINPDLFEKALRAHDLPAGKDVLERFKTYYTYLVEENSKLNLTALTAENDVYLKHFFDSLMLADYVPQLRKPKTRLCDVGAGAGFPSIPLAIVFPELQVTIVDSLQKRIDFLGRLTEKLGLNVALFHARAEEFGNKNSDKREAFDIVTARAVAPMNVLAELCLPLTKVGGQFVAMKGSKGLEELEAAKPAIKTLGGDVQEIVETELPLTGDPRTFALIDKNAATPKRYPRKPGTPSKQPLGGK